MAPLLSPWMCVIEGVSFKRSDLVSILLEGDCVYLFFSLSLLNFDSYFWPRTLLFSALFVFSNAKEEETEWKGTNFQPPSPSSFHFRGNETRMKRDHCIYLRSERLNKRLWTNELAEFRAICFFLKFKRRKMYKKNMIQSKLYIAIF